MTTEFNDKNTTNIAFIGCGNMSTAIINGLVAAGWPASKIIAANPSQAKLDKLKQSLTIKTTADNLAAIDAAEIVVLAVKPQKLPTVCLQASDAELSDKLIISVAAGFQTAQLSKHLQQKTAIVRAMPNTPATIGMGATGLFATGEVTKAQKDWAEAIFAAVGISRWVTDEKLMDVVTAVAGSSPAYIFMMMRAMVEQAVVSGLSEEDAVALITQAVSGAAQLARANPDKPLADLQKEVTSPGGTTEAAIDSFTRDQFEIIVKNAVNASITRGRELGQPIKP